MAHTTTRAYTIKLTGDSNWRELVWKTHIAVNRSAQVWGDWLLTLRGGLPANLATDQPERRVLLALSWFSVESPASLVPRQHILDGTDVVLALDGMLKRFQIPNRQRWIDDCESALAARIRDDAVWVNRAQCFADLQQQCRGLTAGWAAETLFTFLGGVGEYFSLPDINGSATPESKDFVQKADGWLSRNWGSGEKSDSGSISERLRKLADIEPSSMIGATPIRALRGLRAAIGKISSDANTAEELFKLLKRDIGWRRGRPSKGALALEKIRDCEEVSASLWPTVAEKLRQEAAEQTAKGDGASIRPIWMNDWRAKFEQRLGVPYRTTRDLIWEHGVSLDHALRRVSAAHTWIKRAEAERRRFHDDASKIELVPQEARNWLDAYCENRSSESGAIGDYSIRKRAIDGWDKVVQAWSQLPFYSTRQDRINAARDVQKNIDENEKFGDIQLFAGFGDDESERPFACLADDTARLVWQDGDGRAKAAILKDYVDAMVAAHDRQRFKVPAYRHPDPLRHPIWVDYGNSRWEIGYSALAASQQREKRAQQLTKAKSEKARAKLAQGQIELNDLYRVDLGVWNGQTVQKLSLRWAGRRFAKDLGLDQFGTATNGRMVTRADRLGHIAAGQAPGTAVSIAAVFDQKDWNGRLQAPREQLDRLADRVYGKRTEPDFDKLDWAQNDAQAQKHWERLRWFLTTSAKLQPQGPWLTYVERSLTGGIAYKKGRNGHYLDYEANKGRKKRARLELARLPGLRVLSLDLGHRYAASGVVWETLTLEAFNTEVAGREIVAGGVTDSDLFCHTRHVDGRGNSRKTIYRRIGPNKFQGTARHPAPWARLDRQFLIKLQGEDRLARKASPDEMQVVSALREFMGLARLAEVPRVDDLQRDAVRVAKLGLRRLGNTARIAFAMTSTSKPISGGREIELSAEERIRYVQDALVYWHELAKSPEYRDDWAFQQWQSWVVERFGGPQPLAVNEEMSRSERKKAIEAARNRLLTVANQLADRRSADAVELQRLWASRWTDLDAQWRAHLRQLRRLVLPRATRWAENRKSIQQVGGLSLKRLKTIRDLYQVLKAFHMRPEPDDLRKNVPALGDESLARFGSRILNQLERLRQQRIKQIASRVIEAALGAGRMTPAPDREVKRPQRSVDRACHAIVVENLENYRPEDSRLRRENRQLMDWAARNVRKCIVEGCELHGLHFVEVSPRYTSLQDSRTGAPGIRCEDVSRAIIQSAMQQLNSSAEAKVAASLSPQTRLDRDIRRWAGELRRIGSQDNDGMSSRQRILAAIMRASANLPGSRKTIRLPRRGGELFVSADNGSPAAHGLQADLNAAANIGLKALMDPDWLGSWWFVLANVATGQPSLDVTQGCPLWASGLAILSPATTEDVKSSGKMASREAAVPVRRAKTDVYAWNPMFWSTRESGTWSISKDYWTLVEQHIAERLLREQSEPENPF